MNECKACNGLGYEPFLEHKEPCMVCGGTGCASQLGAWNELVEEVKLPVGLSVALLCQRPELLRANVRDMDKEEVRMLLNLVAVLMETNKSLQQHSLELAQEIKEIRGISAGVSRKLDRLTDKAYFRDEDEIGNVDQ